MPPAAKVLGILKPIGGGDPVPLTKEILKIGRRPSCDRRPLLPGRLPASASAAGQQRETESLRH